MPAPLFGFRLCRPQAARAAGAKVYAGAAKRSVLSCLDLSPEDKALITESDEGTNFHAVPMACVSFKRMGHISAHYRGRYDTVVGFAPSGFGAAPSRSAKHGGRKRQKGSFIIYSVPYSEHSRRACSAQRTAQGFAFALAIRACVIFVPSHSLLT